MEKTSYYKAFVAQTPEDILQSILKKEEPILIAISLTNGSYMEGTLLDISAENKHHKSVCMLSENENVSFFNIHDITLVTVKQPKKMVVELSKGAISRPLSSANQELTALQLKRWINNEKLLLGSHINDFKIDTLDLKVLNNRLNIQDVFAALQTAKNNIIIDALGQEAYQTIDTIVLEQAETLQLKIQSKTLTISLAIDKALPENLAHTLEEKLLQIL
ncbi:hypothetical protein ACFFU1_00410 [Algibacter miyuki]|uniref:Uncharacterized protein n=1 Tax=Algibacter miyuki TaxID=1306933 RepID=A0ABV5GWC3_9FLAO|nr:hypothetical protein [Algibacter miyuki]MDN3664671.1 hypothetical protein [Algibacter miyuki]